MNINCNVPWTCYYPYGPIWYLANLPLLLYGWTLPYQIEVYSMVVITTGYLAITGHRYYSWFYLIISVLFIQSGQAYLISSLSFLALGIENPLFLVLSIFDRLPLLTSFDFIHSGSLFERTHIERYALYGVWFILLIIYWIIYYRQDNNVISANQTDKQEVRQE